MKQKRDRYEMHKYWGKKPAQDLRALIERFTSVGDTVLDPFSGYGVLCCEAFLLGRNVISNDLNPVAHFLNKQLVEEGADLRLLQRQWAQIRAEFEPYSNSWFQWQVDGQPVQLTSILRDQQGVPLKARFRDPNLHQTQEIALEPGDVEEFLAYEHSQEIQDWYPDTALIPNSRISAKPGMTVASLFTKRTLACHARLFSLIHQYSSGKERDLLLLAFTANVANCSKLVPPISSRGDMAPGAWMTGFYFAENYIENNVLHYYENRLEKVLKGKAEFTRLRGQDSTPSLFQAHRTNTFTAIQGDAKCLQLPSGSIDYVFTDPPYGDAVPYFEQSVIWNAWLGFDPDYVNEIVISDSKVRLKDTEAYQRDIQIAIAEIHRVLKPGKHLSMTYHSLSGLEWKSITNACILTGFELVDFEWLVQKTFTPRQLNRAKSIKGDVLVTLQKTQAPKAPVRLTDLELKRFFLEKLQDWLSVTDLDTNEIFLRMMKLVFEKRLLVEEVDLLEVLNSNFRFMEDNQWTVYDRAELQPA